MIIVIIVLLIAFMYLNVTNKQKEEQIKHLEQKVLEINNKEQLTNNYKDKIETMKSINQKLIGQENKVEELSIQIKLIKETIIKNKQEIEKY